MALSIPSIGLPTKLLIGVGLFGIGLALGFRWGAGLVRGQWDLASTRGDRDRAVAIQRQHDHVADTDRAGLRIDADMRVDLGRIQIQAPQRLEVVTHAVHIDPQLGAVRLPAAVVRVRADQAAQSHRIARQAAAAVRRAAAAVPADPGGR